MLGSFRSVRILAPMTVYIIDNHPLVSDTLTQLVHRVRPEQKVMSVRSIAQLESAVKDHDTVELVITELDLPDTRGVMGVQQIKKAHRQIPLVVFSDNEVMKHQCLQAGADDFVHKSTSVRDILLKLIEWLPNAADPNTPERPMIKLSKRQKQLLVMLYQGLNNEEIAQAMGIANATAKVHLWRYYKQLGVGSRLEAVNFARTHGYL